MDLPMGLVSAMETGNCVLFVGAGAGYHVFNAEGQHAPDGAELADLIAAKYTIDTEGERDLAKVAQVAELRRGRADLLGFLEKTLSGYEPDADLRWLVSRTWRAIFTTNYDSMIERCYELDSDVVQTPVSMGIDSEVRRFDPNFEVPIYHLHGSLASSDARNAILLTSQDYVTFRQRRQMLFEQFKHSFATTPIFYFGYSNSDANWQEIISELRAQFAPSEPPTAYRLVPSTSLLDREILQSQNIHTLDGKLQEFRTAVESQLGDLRVEPHKLKEIAKNVPSDLAAVFEESPAATMRLLNSWEYVNQADFAGPANTREFLQGNRPNWALVGNGINFERDLEAPLVEALVEHVTDADSVAQAHIILGPAGYGQTTLLMAITAWFAKSRAGGSALFLRPGADPLEGDIEFAINHLPNQPVVLFVDNAADYTDELVRVMELLRRLKSNALLMLAERLNEWRQRKPRLYPTEHELFPLSDPEIDRLVERLDQTDSLGVLKGLSPELRFAAIKNRNQQELLVTMREATEGRAFDAIVEDEYRNIRSDKGRQLYALAAIFSRVRTLAREALCASALGVNVTALFHELAAETEGVVVFDVIDEARGIYGARTRHHVIADIVWRRCLTDEARETLLMNALSNLNLTYGIDRNAFEKLTRDDAAVDSLRGLEAKIRFFETAVRKDPTDPFVRQHFARMLRRENRLDLALGQIDAALEMSPRSRVLHHTRGVILGDIAMDSDIDEFARRRLAQAEESFRSTINMAPRDDYGYQSLAGLYLDWAKRCAGNPSESVSYVSKAQEVLFKGLTMVRDRESLYVASSNIEAFLQNDSARIDALRKALLEAPHSPIARYLLGSVLLKTGDIDNAVEILTEGVRLHPEHPRIVVACALAMYAGNSAIEEILAVLNLASTSGMDDPFYIAVLSGMQILAGEVQAATQLLDRSRQRELSRFDRDRVGFVAAEKGQPKVFQGRLVKVIEGFGFARVAGMPDIFCAPKSLKDKDLSEGAEVRLTVGFTARGPHAVSLQPAS